MLPHSPQAHSKSAWTLYLTARGSSSHLTCCQPKVVLSSPLPSPPVSRAPKWPSCHLNISSEGCKGWEPAVTIAASSPADTKHNKNHCLLCEQWRSKEVFLGKDSFSCLVPGQAELRVPRAEQAVLCTPPTVPWTDPAAWEMLTCEMRYPSLSTAGKQQRLINLKIFYSILIAWSQIKGNCSCQEGRLSKPGKITYRKQRQDARESLQTGAEEGSTRETKVV